MKKLSIIELSSSVIALNINQSIEIKGGTCDDKIRRTKTFSKKGVMYQCIYTQSLTGVIRVLEIRSMEGIG